MIAVDARVPAYRHAVAELPLRTRRAAAPEGAVVVLAGGRGWPAHVVAAAQRGAIAVVVVDPVAGTTDALDVLSEVRVPVLIDRPALRADVTADAAVPSRSAMLSVIAASTQGSAEPTVRDAIGWLRVLAGEDLALSASHRTPRGAMALFDAPVPATLQFAVLTGSEPRLRALAIGPERTEVRIGAGDEASVVVACADGMLRHPRRYETPARVTLRRAIDAVDGTAPTPTDVADLRHDSSLAAAILQAG